MLGAVIFDGASPVHHISKNSYRISMLPSKKKWKIIVDGYFAIKNSQRNDYTLLIITYI